MQRKELKDVKDKAKNDDPKIAEATTQLQDAIQNQLMTNLILVGQHMVTLVKM